MGRYRLFPRVAALCAALCAAFSVSAASAEATTVSFAPGWNVFSTPKVLSGISFSRAGAGLTFYRMDSGVWRSVAASTGALRPLEGFVVNNSGTGASTATLSYAENLSPMDMLFQRTLSSGWNILGVTTSASPFATLASAATYSVDFTNGAAYSGEATPNSNAMSGLFATTSGNADIANPSVTKAYAVFVSQSGAVYGGSQQPASGSGGSDSQTGSIVRPTVSVNGAALLSTYTRTQAQARFAAGLVIDTANAAYWRVGDTPQNRFATGASQIVAAAAADASATGSHSYWVQAISAEGYAVEATFAYVVNADGPAPILPTVALVGSDINSAYTVSEAAARFANGIRYTVTNGASYSANGGASVPMGTGSVTITVATSAEAVTAGGHNHSLVVTSPTGHQVIYGAMYTVTSGSVSTPLLQVSPSGTVALGTALAVTVTTYKSYGSVEIYASGSKIAELGGNSPYSVSWTPSAAGTYVLSARTFSEITNSNTVTVTVTAGGSGSGTVGAPTVTLVGAAINPSYTVSEATARFANGIRFSTANAVIFAVNSNSTAISSGATVTAVSAADAVTVGSHSYRIDAISATSLLAEPTVVVYEVTNGGSGSGSVGAPTVTLVGADIENPGTGSFVFTYAAAAARFANGVQFNITNAATATVLFNNGASGGPVPFSTGSTITVATAAEAVTAGYHSYYVLVTSPTGQQAWKTVYYTVERLAIVPTVALVGAAIPSFNYEYPSAEAMTRFANGVQFSTQNAVSYVIGAGNPVTIASGATITAASAAEAMNGHAHAYHVTVTSITGDTASVSAVYSVTPITPAITLVGARPDSGVPYTVSEAAARFADGIQFSTVNAASVTVNGVSVATGATVTAATVTAATTAGSHRYDVVATSVTGHSDTYYLSYQVVADAQIVPEVSLSGNPFDGYEATKSLTPTLAAARLANGLQFATQNAVSYTVNGGSSVSIATGATITAVSSADAVTVGSHSYRVIVKSTTNTTAETTVAYTVTADIIPTMTLLDVYETNAVYTISEARALFPEGVRISVTGTVSATVDGTPLTIGSDNVITVLAPSQAIYRDTSAGGFLHSHQVTLVSPTGASITRVLQYVVSRDPIVMSFSADQTTVQLGGSVNVHLGLDLPATTTQGIWKYRFMVKDSSNPAAPNERFTVLQDATATKSISLDIPVTASFNTGSFWKTDGAVPGVGSYELEFEAFDNLGGYKKETRALTVTE